MEQTTTTERAREWAVVSPTRESMAMVYAGDQLARIGDVLEAIAPPIRNGAGEVVGRRPVGVLFEVGVAPEPAAVGHYRTVLERIANTPSERADELKRWASEALGR